MGWAQTARGNHAGPGRPSTIVERSATWASPAQVSVAYLLGKPGVSSVIIGARKEEQLADNLGAINVRLSQQEIDRLDVVSAPDLIYPHWHQANLVADRFSQADLALHRPAR